MSDFLSNGVSLTTSTIDDDRANAGRADALSRDYLSLFCEKVVLRSGEGKKSKFAAE